MSKDRSASFGIYPVLCIRLSSRMELLNSLYNNKTAIRACNTQVTDRDLFIRATLHTDDRPLIGLRICTVW